MVAALLLHDGIGHAAALAGVVHFANQGDLLSGALMAPDVLLDLPAVVADHRVGRLHDVLGAAVVLFEFEGLDAEVGEVPLEVQDVLDGRAPEGVDRLGVVTHHADVARALGVHHQLLDDGVLQGVRILELVHQHVLELAAVLVGHLSVVLQQFEEAEEQVVKIHRAGLLAAGHVGGVDLADERHLGGLILRQQFGRLGVELGGDQAGLGAGDPVLDGVGLVDLLVQVHLLHDLVDQAFGVVRVVDREVTRVADVLGLHAQDAGKETMEGARPDVGGLLTHHLADALLHFPCRLVGERQGQDLPGRRPLLDDVGDAVGEHPRFARSGTGHHQHRTLDGRGGLPLYVVQFVEVVGRGSGRDGIGHGRGLRERRRYAERGKGRKVFYHNLWGGAATYFAFSSEPGTRARAQIRLPTAAPDSFSARTQVPDKRDRIASRESCRATASERRSAQRKPAAGNVPERSNSRTPTAPPAA